MDFFCPCCVQEKKGNTIIKLLCCLGVKVEVFEEFGGPVLLVALTVTPLPPQVTPRVLQLQETHPLQEQHAQSGHCIAFLHLRVLLNYNVSAFYMFNM